MFGDNMKKILIIIAIFLIIASGILTLNIINFCILTNNIESTKENIKKIDKEDTINQENYNKLTSEYEDLKKEKDNDLKEYEKWENLLKVIKEKL